MHTQALEAMWTTSMAETACPGPAAQAVTVSTARNPAADPAYSPEHGANTDASTYGGMPRSSIMAAAQLSSDSLSSETTPRMLSPSALPGPGDRRRYA